MDAGDVRPNDPVYAGIEVTGIPSASTDTQLPTAWFNIGTPSASTATQPTGTPSASSTDTDTAKWWVTEGVQMWTASLRRGGSNDMDQWESGVWSGGQWPAYSAYCIESVRDWSMTD